MSNWKEYSLSEIGNIITGYTPPILNKTKWDGNVAFYSPADFGQHLYCNKTERTISETALQRNRTIPVNSIMVTCIGSTIGKMSLAGNYGITNQQINTIVCDVKFHYLFIYYSLLYNIKQIDALYGVTAIPIVNKQQFSTIRLPIPAFSIQQKIAKILSIIDGQIEKTEAIIAKYQAVKQGMLQDLFTRGIDVTTGELRPKYEDAPELYKDSPLGMIPKDWDVESLDQVCKMRSGEGITAETISEVGEYPVYGGNGLRGFTDKYTHDGYYILIGRQGALCGNITKASGKFYASEHAVVVTLHENMDTDWLSEKLEMMTLNKYSEASAQPGLSVSKILRLKIVKPKYQEQKSISSKINQANEKLRIEGKYLIKTRFIKQGLMSDLLSGKVEVTA